jgi:PAS domain S-box-containing protein
MEKAGGGGNGTALMESAERQPDDSPTALPPGCDLEDFFENGAVALHLVAADGTILRANQAELDLLGYRADEYVGRHIAEFHADQDAIGDILYRLSSGEKLDKYPAKLRAKTGGIKDVLVSSSVQFRNGKFINTRCFTVDVTELKRTQDALRESEWRMRELLDALPAAIYTTDASGAVTYYNPASIQLAGRVPEIGKDEWCVTWRLYTPDGQLLPHEQCPMAVALKENRAIRGVEAVAERPDGARTPILPFPTPIQDAAGNLVGAVNMLVDISERKEAESRQQMLLNELNHRIKNNLQMLHSLLRSAGRDTANPEARSVLADASQRVAAVAAAQRTLYAADSPRSFDAAEFIEAVCNSARQSFEKDVTVEIASMSGKLHNDVSLPLALILNELLTNAVKHGLNGHGGVIKVDLREAGDDLQLSVTDQGRGFVLDPAQTGPRSSGIGLILGLAQQIGGSFHVDSGPGARCIVTFPKTAAVAD